MRILFICPSQEPGRCGVGDYTRRLAEACIERGVACAIVALNDKAAEVNVENGNAEMRKLESGKTEIRKFAMPAEQEQRNVVSQQETDSSIPVLRLSSALPWKDRVEQAREFLLTFAPEWVSLQYVPYGYDRRGLPFGLAERLQQIFSGPFHLMAHELWEVGPGWKGHLRGRLQKWILRRMNGRLRFGCVHTSIAHYQRMLKGAGVASGMLPLFGNIPVVESESPPPKKEGCGDVIEANPHFPALRSDQPVLSMATP